MQSDEVREMQKLKIFVFSIMLNKLINQASLTKTYRISKPTSAFRRTKKVCLILIM